MTHVRLPVDPDKLSIAHFTYLDQALGWANKNHLGIILSIHPSSRLALDAGTNSQALEELKRVWAEIARRYRQEPETVFYELLNEPQVENASVWHDVAQSLVERIRQIDRKHTLIVAAPGWSTPERMADLVPVSD